MSCSSTGESSRATCQSFQADGLGLTQPCHCGIDHRMVEKPVVHPAPTTTTTFPTVVPSSPPLPQSTVVHPAPTTTTTSPTVVPSSPPLPQSTVVHPAPTTTTTSRTVVPSSPPLPQSTAVPVQPVAPLPEVAENAVVEGTVGGKKKRRSKGPSGPKMSDFQKDKVREYAENMHWSMIKADEEKMIRLCNEIGITTQKCINWINNNRKNRTPATKLTL